MLLRPPTLSGSRLGGRRVVCHCDLARSATTRADFPSRFAFVNTVLGNVSIALAIGLLQLDAGRAATWATGLAFVSPLLLTLGTVATGGSVVLAGRV
jgi:hypothetical protein